MDGRADTRDYVHDPSRQPGVVEAGGKVRLPGCQANRVQGATNCDLAAPAGVVGTGGFEPPTCRLGGDRSIHLSYVPD